MGKIAISSCLFLFVTLSGLVHTGVLQSLDNYTSLFLQNNISSDLALFLSTIGLLGSFEITFIIAIFYLIYLSAKGKKGFWLIFFIFIILIVEAFTKILINQKPPAEFFSKYYIQPPLASFNLKELILAIFPLFKLYGSFPSGHMARTTFISAIIFLPMIKTWLKDYKKRTVPVITSTVIFISVLTLMGVSKIYLGEHWLSDVVGGFLLGGSLALLILTRMKLGL